MKKDQRQDAVPQAIALQWDRLNAPRITAAGKGLTAEEILRIAGEQGIPLQSDPILVEALAQIPIGDEIPRNLYIAVAEVLAFIFMLEGIDPRKPTLLDQEPAEQE